MTESHATSDSVFDTDTERFANEVIERSRRVTVAVDFWAPWCGPCRALAPLLEQLAAHYGGGLVVARVNIDADPAIAAQFGIRSIPDVRIFRDARVVDGFVGVHPLPRLQALFDRYVTSESEAHRSQARELLQAGRLDEALTALRELVAADPANTSAVVDLADALARAGRLDESEAALGQLPANAAGGKEMERVRARIALARDAAGAEEVPRLRSATAGSAGELHDLYRLGAYELLHGDATRGLELLLTLMQRDRRFADGLPRRALVQAFAVLGDDDERVAQYRRRMAALLH